MMHDQIRRAIDDAFNRGGMTVGLPKVTVDASQLKHLLDIADAQRVRISELEAQGIQMWQAGYARGHDDTVEGAYNPGWETDPEAALDARAALDKREVKR